MSTESMVLRRPARKQRGPLRKRRAALGLTQQEVSDCLLIVGITRDGLARLELGEKWPNPRQIVALAQFYEVDVGVMATEIIAGWLARRNLSSKFVSRFDSHQPSLPLAGGRHGA